MGNVFNIPAFNFYKEESSPDFGEKTTNDLGEKLAPEVAKKPLSSFVEKTVPNFAKKTALDYDEKIAPDFGKKKAPNCSEKTTTNFGKKTAPDMDWPIKLRLRSSKKLKLRCRVMVRKTAPGCTGYQVQALTLRLVRCSCPLYRL